MSTITTADINISLEELKTRVIYYAKWADELIDQCEGNVSAKILENNKNYLEELLRDGKFEQAEVHVTILRGQCERVQEQLDWY